jgi:thiol peroxidase
MKLGFIVMAGLLSIATLHAAETTETVTLSGTTVKLIGNMISVGDDAPLVKLVNSDLKDVTVGGKTEKTQVLVVVPSIDTPVCNIEAGKFNEKAAAMPNVEMTVISMDLPFASQRYCAAHGIKNITIASDFRSKAFGKAYGTLIGDSVLEGLEARTIFIIKNGKVTYKQLVPEITTEPDYDAVLKAI